MEGVEPVVSDEMRAALANPYISEEFGVAIREMARLKAPGPDGMPMYAATTKLKRCKKHLKAWSWDHVGNVLRKIKIVKE